MHTLSKFSFNYYRNINFNHSLNQFLRRCSIGYTGRGCQRCPYPTYGNDCKHIFAIILKDVVNNQV